MAPKELVATGEGHMDAVSNKGVDAVSTAYSQLPIIDIQPLMAKGEALSEEDLKDPDVAAVVQQIDKVCREIGFFYLVGHGVPQSMIDGVRDVGREFFSLPIEEKMKIHLSKAPNWYRGYQEMRSNVTLGKRDWHEAVDLFPEISEDDEDFKAGKPLHAPNLWPEKPESFRPLMENYRELMKGVGRQIMKGIGLAVGGQPSLFEENKTDKTFSLIRVIGYPQLQASCAQNGLANGCEQDITPAEISCGEHTDYGLLTMVNQDPDVSALQVKNKDGTWIWARPIEGAFVVNIGDMLTIWTNGMYPATLHRVINKTPKYRVSIPFFYEPNFETTVEPLDICRDGGTKPALYSPVHYGESLTKKVYGNFY